MDDSHRRSVDEVLRLLSTNLDKGLTSEGVRASAEKYGRNELPPEEGTPFWKLVLKQFDDQMVQILLVAAGISFGLALFEESEDRVQAFVEPLVILFILIANAAVGVIQETNAEKAIEALKAYEPNDATVVRDGKRCTIEASELVIGDVVDIAVGERIPADLRLASISSTTLRIDQAILTGESVSVSKDTSPIQDSNNSAVNQDKINMCFSGTNVAIGRGRGVVVAIAGKTEMGKIRRTIIEEDETRSPLNQKLDEFGEGLSKVIAVICVLVWLINIGHFSDPVHGGYVKGAIYYFKIAVALAVAAIPEGLPAVVTTCLALGTKKMAAKNAIVRSLPSVETLGCTTVICSDKTGTLTTNKMSVSKIMIVENDKGSFTEFDVAGETFAPYGSISVDGSELSLPDAAHPSLYELSAVASLCNDSEITYNAETDSFEKMGEATEVALKVMAEKVGLPATAEQARLAGLGKAERVSAVSEALAARYTKNATLEFSRDRKSMSVHVSEGQTGTVTRSGRSSRAPNAQATHKLFVKGAPEAILARCSTVRLNSNGKTVSLTNSIKNQIMEVITRYGTGADTLRVLGFAVIDEAKPLDGYDLGDPARFAEVEKDMTFIGLAGMLDPPRKEVKAAIETCRTAGIRVIVITGDNKGTAEAICRRIGVFTKDEDLTGKSFTGKEFAALSEEEQMAAILDANLFCRVEPVHKSQLVDLLRKNQEVVAMTGDGVNDAPALKKADIGIAMGSGTPVAKGASEMVLADDNFATIVSAVEEGRAIYNNTKQFIRYLISSNIGEVACIFFSAALGMPEALIPVQLLFVNLVTDGGPATALSFNPADKDIMTKPPRGRNDSIVSGWLFFRYLAIGIYVGIATVAGFAWWYMYYSEGPMMTFAQLTDYRNCSPDMCHWFDVKNASTVSLSILVTIEMFNALNSLSENQSIFAMPPWVNPVLILAVIISFVFHAIILYIPAVAAIFSVAPIGLEEWKAVIYISAPVIIIDELLKFLARSASSGVSNKGPSNAVRARRSVAYADKTK